jgi:hypothetical protein
MFVIMTCAGDSLIDGPRVTCYVIVMARQRMARLNVLINARAYDALKELAAQNDETLSMAVRRAVVLGLRGLLADEDPDHESARFIWDH